MRSTFSVITCALCLLGRAAVFGQAAPATDAGTTSRTLNATYIAAFNRGDAKSLAALFAEEAHYSTDGGQELAGRAAVEKALSEFFARNKGATLTTEITAARHPTPEMLIEKGFATVATPGARNPDTTRYSATYVKTGGTWVIADLDETILPPAEEAVQALAALEWLVGTWQDVAGKGMKVETRVSWTLNHHFLRRSFTVTPENEEVIEGTEVIGYDAASGRIRSWTFDSEGGFAESLWRQDGNKWMVTVMASLPDGSRSSSEQILTMVDPKKLTWESQNRVIDGEAMPNLDRIEVVRTEPK